MPLGVNQKRRVGNSQTGHRMWEGTDDNCRNRLMPSGRKASLNRFLTQIEGGTGVLCLLSYSPSLGSHQQIQHRQLPPENQATEGKDVLELQGRGPQMERTNRWSARSFQRLQTISSSISSLILLSSTSAGFLLSGKFQLMIQQRIGPGDGIKNRK